MVEFINDLLYSSNGKWNIADWTPCKCAIRVHSQAQRFSCSYRVRLMRKERSCSWSYWVVVEVRQIPQDENWNNLLLFGVSNMESQVVSNLKKSPGYWAKVMLVGLNVLKIELPLLNLCRLQSEETRFVLRHAFFLFHYVFWLINDQWWPCLADGLHETFVQHIWAC